MRTAGLVLSILGCVFTFFLGLILTFGGVAFTAAMPSLLSEIDSTDEDYENLAEYDIDSEEAKQTMKFGSYVFLGAGIASLLSFVLSLIGLISFKKRQKLPGVLFLVAAFFAVFSLWGIFSALLLILAGIFTLIDSKNSANKYPVLGTTENFV